jgi:hypothetical protein
VSLEVARGRRRGAARCSPNIWYQSEKILEAYSDGGVMPLETAVVAADSMGGGVRRREAELVGGVMPRAASCGVMLLGGDGGGILLQEDDGVMPSQGDIGAMPMRRDGGHEGSSLL